MDVVDVNSHRFVRAKIYFSALYLTSCKGIDTIEASEIAPSACLSSAATLDFMF